MKKALFSILVVMVASVAVSFGQRTVRVGRAQFQGINVNYSDRGPKNEKRALVFVHCWTCNSDFWKESVNAFPYKRVITLDLPGHGQSDKPKVDYTMEYFARSVEAVMKKAGVDKAVLVGHSMGTPVVRKFYELYPQKTLGLVIVDGALMPFGPKEEVAKFFEPLYKDYKKGSAMFLDNMLKTADPAIQPFVRTTMLGTADYVAISAMKEMTDDAYADHPKINVPVLAVMAENEMWPKDLEDQYRQRAPKVEFHAWTGVSHFLMLERPEQFNSLIKNFVSKAGLL